MYSWKYQTLIIACPKTSLLYGWHLPRGQMSEIIKQTTFLYILSSGIINTYYIRVSVLSFRTLNKNLPVAITLNKIMFSLFFLFSAALVVAVSGHSVFEEDTVVVTRPRQNAPMFQAKAVLNDKFVNVNLAGSKLKF